MHIDRINTSLITLDGSQTSNSKEAKQSSASSIAARPALLAQTGQGETQPVSVVLKLQAGSTGAMDALQSGSLLYSNGRQNLAPATDEANLGSMAREHRQAIDRNAGVFTKISLDKDGVMSVKQLPAPNSKPPDFVTFAVSVMRDYADEAERLKKSSHLDSASAMQASQGKFRSLQQFAAKLNIFA